MGFGYIFGFTSRALDEGPVTQTRSGALILTDDSDLISADSLVALNLISPVTDGLRLGRSKIQAVNANGARAAKLFLNYHGGGIDCGRSKISAASFIATSSRDKKTDITPFQSSALDLINQTKIVNYKYKSDEEKNPYVGFIAEDTPEPLVTPDHKEMSINSCIGLLLKAVQELDAKIEGVKHA